MNKEKIVMGLITAGFLFILFSIGVAIYNAVIETREWFLGIMFVGVVLIVGALFSIMIDGATY